LSPAGTMHQLPLCWPLQQMCNPPWVISGVLAQALQGLSLVVAAGRVQRQRHTACNVRRQSAQKHEDQPQAPTQEPPWTPIEAPQAQPRNAGATALQEGAFPPVLAQHYSAGSLTQIPQIPSAIPPEVPFRSAPLRFLAPAGAPPALQFLCSQKPLPEKLRGVVCVVCAAQEADLLPG